LAKILAQRENGRERSNIEEQQLKIRGPGRWGAAANVGPKRQHFTTASTKPENYYKYYYYCKYYKKLLKVASQMDLWDE
jgi:hypothetical protein